jgi:hypothetical protein
LNLKKNIQLLTKCIPTISHKAAEDQWLDAGALPGKHHCMLPDRHLREQAVFFTRKKLHVTREASTISGLELNLPASSSLDRVFWNLFSVLTTWE